MSDHHREQKAKIISAAFSEWGKTHFTTMSLMRIARKLSITKPALYRYFKSKDDLLQTMVRTMIDELSAGVTAFLDVSKPTSLGEAVREYYGFIFDFFTTYPFYLAFLLFYIIRKLAVRPPGLAEIGKKLRDYFMTHLDFQKSSPDPSAVNSAVRYIQIHGIFWILQAFGSDKSNNSRLGIDPRLLDFNRRIDKKTVSYISEQAVDYCINGYCRNVSAESIDFDSITTAAWIRPSDLLEADRIFSAIEAVIGEEGFSGASVERIAERIGINKSSLYFYFKNKNDMLSQTISREQDHFLALLIQRIAAQKNFAEKLFAFCVAVLSHMLSNPVLVSVMHWIHYQNIGVTLPKKDLSPFIDKFDFIPKAVMSGELQFHGGAPVLVLIFIFFFLMNEIRVLPKKGGRPEQYMSHLSHIFLMFCGGIDGRQRNHPQKAVEGVYHASRDANHRRTFLR